LGIDPDADRIAWCAIRPGLPPETGTIPRRNYRGLIDYDFDSKLDGLMRRARDLDAVLFFEGVFIGPNPQSSLELAAIGGEVRAAARRAGVKTISVQPVVWMKSILGLTRGREVIKAASACKAREITGLSELSQHESDAACIALYGLVCLQHKNSNAMAEPVGNMLATTAMSN
jgi:Holliday junction resolvasome RuvABC endonuclease subunit